MTFEGVFAYAILLLAVEDLLNCAAWDQNKSGPYSITAKALESCPDAHKYKISWGRRLSRYNRTTFTYTSQIYLPYDFDDTWAADINIAVFGNGGYKDNFYNIHIDDICSFLENLLQEEVARLLENIKTDRFCPTKAGKYNITNYIVKIGDLPGFPSLPYGMYRIEAINTKTFENNTKQLIACFRCLVEVVPKKPY